MDSVKSRDVAHRASEQVSEGADSRASWRMAWLVLAILSISYASPLVIVVGMKPMQEALGTDRSVLALAGSLVWVGTGSGGILMGWLADRIGLRRTVAIGAVMIAGRVGAVVGRRDLDALCRPRAAGLPRQWWRLPAAAGLCQPLVRAPAWGCDRADLLGPVCRRRGVALLLRARHDHVRLAGGDAGLRHFCARGHPARDRVPQGAAQAAPVPVRRAGARGGRAAARRRHASQRGAGADLPRRFLLLHSDVDPVGAYRRLLRRSRHQADAWRGDAVADAGVRLPLAPGSGARWPTGSAVCAR